VTRLRYGGVVNDSFIAHLPVNLSVKNFENRSTFGEVMENIIMACFLTHSVCLPGLELITLEVVNLSYLLSCPFEVECMIILGL